MRNKNSASILASLGVTLACACGGLGDVDDAPPLAVIDGRLDQASTNPAAQPANVRVAVIWTTSNTSFKSSHDVSVAPVFPSKFRLELKDLPPADAMVTPRNDIEFPAPTGDGPPSMRQQTYPLDNGARSLSKYALGSIVAYEDKNGNGRLDLLRPDDPAIDRVLGVNDELLLVYVEGDATSVDGLGASGSAVKGYNLLKRPACVARRPADGAAAPPACEPSVWLPISTLYDLPLSSEPQLAEAMCGNTDGTSSASPTTSNVKPGEALPAAPGPDGWPKKGDENLVCEPDGKSYAFYRCESTSLGLCRGTHETCSKNSYGLPSATPPPEWPCVVK